MNSRVMNGGKISAGAGHSAHNAEIAQFVNRSMAEVSSPWRQDTSRAKQQTKNT